MSASESAFSDAEDDSAVRVGPCERKRLRSVEDMVKAMEGKRKRVVSPRQAEKVSRDERSEFMNEINQMIEVSIRSAVEKLWEKIDGKMSSLETKIDKLEGQIFERDQLVDELQDKLRVNQEHLSALEEQVEDLERNSRSASLIFRSNQIGKRVDGEDIVEKTIKLINDNFSTQSVDKKDFSAVHRLSNENTVICAFVNKNLRNAIYDERLSLRRREVGRDGRLYVNESLTKSKREIFSKLLEMRKEKRIWTAFTKNGIPCCKMTKDSPSIKVLTLRQLDQLARRGPAVAAPAGGARAGDRGRPPPPAWLPRGGRPDAVPPPPAACAVDGPERSHQPSAVPPESVPPHSPRGMTSGSEAG